jgi:signal transduction histidine kinase
VRRPLTLSTRLTLFFAGAVLASTLLYGGMVTAVLVMAEWREQREAPPGPAKEGLFDDAWQALGAVALAAPLAVLGAVMLGRALAHQALAPMREASARARAARAAELDLSLPVRGTQDEWDELASTLNGLLADARGAFARVRTFTADAAHELRTPLTVIMGEAEVALRRPRSAEEYHRALELVYAESRGLARLVDALLLLARGDAGALATEAEPVDLSVLARHAIQRAEHLPTPRTRDVGIELSAATVLVDGNPVLLAHVLDNLLANALRHGRSRVQVDVRAEGTEARLTVTDDGAGVEPAFLPRLFQRFARADAARASGGGGTGLGLALSRTIVEAHRGTLSYERSPQGESLFTARLPVRPPPPHPDASPRLPGDASDGSTRA